jgi:hypothetical protein
MIITLTSFIGLVFFIVDFVVNVDGIVELFSTAITCYLIVRNKLF